MGRKYSFSLRVHKMNSVLSYTYDDKHMMSMYPLSKKVLGIPDLKFIPDLTWDQISVIDTIHAGLRSHPSMPKVDQ